MVANGGTLVCYEDVREVFVSRKESVFPMETYLDMGNQFIYNVKTPINIDQGVNKSYADTKLSLSGGLMTGNLDMNNNRIYNVAQPNGDNNNNHHHLYWGNFFIKDMVFKKDLKTRYIL